MTRLCRTKSIVTVNGQIPGPRIIAREGDRLLIKVVNHVQYNVTLHWYGSLIKPPITVSFSFVDIRLNFLSLIEICDRCCVYEFGEQAWNQATKERMGRWTCLRNTVPNSNGTELCIQFHSYWTKRDIVLACSHFMVKSYPLWTHCHPP